MPTFTMPTTTTTTTTTKTETETDAPLSMSTRVMAREQNRNARLKALRDGTFEEVNMDDDTIVEALVAGPSPAGTIAPVADEADEALWISDAVCEKPFVDAAIVISDDEDDEDDEESEVAEVAEAEVAEVAEAKVAEAEVGQAPRLPFSCPFMLLPTHDSDPDPDHDLTCPESPVSPASPAAPEAPEAVEDIDTVARRRASNDALRAGFAKARAAIEAIEEEEEEDQGATPPIAAEVLALQVVSAPQARQPPDTQVTVADTEMVAEATEEGPDSYAPDAQDPQALPLPHANGTMPTARSALRSLGTWSPAGPSPAIRKSRRSKK